jgi:hypothetical protein
MRPTRVTVAGIGISAPIVLDHGQSPSTVAIGVIISATATYTVEHTFDDPFAAGGLASATWLPHSTLNAKTTNADGNYAYPPTACRLNVSASTGNVTMTVVTAGVT